MVPILQGATIKRITMNKIFTFLVLVKCLVNTTIYASDDIDPFSDEFIESINRKQSLWVAGRNFDKEIAMKYMKGMKELPPPSLRSTLPEIRHDVNIEIPESFDWRDRYPSCTTLRTIRDQGDCLSCWAVGSASAISDRICIHSEGKIDVYISENNLMTCCRNCWLNGTVCGGGFHSAAYQYWMDVGIVSGGPYNSFEGCQPYRIPGEGFFYKKHSNRNLDLRCEERCRDGYLNTYQGDHHFAKSVYGVPRDVKQIQIEIIKNGPVTAWYQVYADFMVYRHGVYRHTEGQLKGNHIIKILGWGNEGGKPYWLVANSWSTQYALNGYFKILRGYNHCGIEQHIVAGIPESYL